MYLDFLMLRVTSLLESNHSATLLSSEFTSDSNKTILEFCAHRNVSSAKSLIYRDVASGRSLINNKNKRGPKIEPWGTPISISKSEDLTPFTLTYCDLFVKYDLNSLRGGTKRFSIFAFFGAFWLSFPHFLATGQTNYLWNL